MRLTTVTAALSGLVMTAGGLWALTDAASFADFVRYPAGTHFIHDAGAFQLGLGVMLLLAILWRDAMALALFSFLVANTAHAVNHALDTDLGGIGYEAPAFAALSVLVAAAFVARMRELGWVVGYVRDASLAPLEPFIRQKTVALTSFRRDGSPVPAPVSIAVDGDHAYVRTFERAWKTKRIRNNPHVTVAPSDWRGRPTGAAVPFTARRLDGAEAARAARLLGRKHPMLHRVVVPAAHRLMRTRTGRTVHFELRLAPGD